MADDDRKGGTRWRPISIWRPEPAGADGGDAVWRRPPPSPLGDHYAERRSIPRRPPPGVRRLCWFGESAAAGYLYAPHLTPARVLEAQLRAAAAGSGGRADGWEVIDLARTNERAGTLAETVEAAEQLAPDHLVIYAGNNWNLLETTELSPHLPGPGRRELAAVLRGNGREQGRLAGPPDRPAQAAARLARRRVAERAAAALERVAVVAGRLDVPVTLVLPEVSLADWETGQPPVRLPGNGTARWFALHDRALAALAAGDPTGAEVAAWEMVELDGATCPTPFRLLAAAAAAQGDPPAARDAALSEVDATHYPLLAFLAAPQAGEAARRVLELAAERHGFGAVDLRRIFAEWTGSPFPGRRLFLDYCHLTAEGMRLAAAAVAEEVLRAAEAPAYRSSAAESTGARATTQRGWRTLARELPFPDPGPAAHATAALGAAVHTAHRQLPVTERREVLDHWCAEALEHDPEGAAAAMLDLADVRTGTAPAVLTAAQERNLDRPAPLLLQHGWRWPHLDAGLLRAMAGALGERGLQGKAERIGELVAGRRSAPPEGIELAHPPFHLAEPLLQPFPDAMAPAGMAERAYLRLLWPRCAFDVVLPPEAGAELAVTARLPELEEGDRRRVEVLLDGRPAGFFAAGPRWARARLRLPPPGPSGPAGLHRLELRWPMPPDAGSEPLAAVARALAADRDASLHPVFGELASLRLHPPDAGRFIR